MSKIFKIFPQNKKPLILIGLGLSLMFLPFGFVYAQDLSMFCPGCGPLPWQWPTCIVCFVQYLISLPIRLPFFLLALVLGLIALVSGVIFSVIVSLLNWLKTIALSVPITHGGVVDIGWTFTRDFANMFFVLILVFIGLATILKLRDYEAKKTLPKLIFVALLINFTPIIVGFIVDVANIFTNFFLTRAGECTSLTNILDEAVNYIITSFWTIFTVDGLFFEHLLTDYNGNPAIIGVLMGIVVYGLVLIVFYGLATLIYLLVFILLFARILFLWILMILAPIAFFSQALPPSKTVKAIFPSILHWDEWWEKLIQWSILGIPLGFFLYLSNWVMKNQDLMNTVLDPGGLNVQNITSGSLTINLAPGVGIITSILTPLISLVLLGFGAMVSIQTAPAGAKQIIDFAKKGGVAAAGLTAGTIRGIPQVSQAEETMRRRMETMPVIGRMVGGPGAFEAERRAQTAKARERLEKIPDTLEGNQAIQQRIARTPLTLGERQERVAGLEILAQRGALHAGAPPAYLQEAQRMGANMNQITAARPDWATVIPPAPGAPPPPVGVTPQDWAITQRMTRIRANQARNIQTDALSDPTVVRSLNRDQIQDLTRAGSPRQKQAIVNTIRAIAGWGPWAFMVGIQVPGINQNVINYIADQQAAGTWPI